MFYETKLIGRVRITLASWVVKMIEHTGDWIGGSRE